MSMIDEIPTYFIKNGIIYMHHEGETYYDVDWGETSDPDWDEKLCEDTLENRSKYFHIYSYDEHKYVN